MSAAVGLVLSSVSILAAEPILELYGEDFAAAKAVYIVMMIAAVLSAVNEILQQALLGMGAPLVRLGTSTLRAGVFVGSALVLVPVSLGLGLALSRLAAASVYLVVQLPLYCYRIRTTQYE
jgi:O-antigen/teichoic acid export membrane protein